MFGEIQIWFWVDDFDEWVVDVYNLKIVLNEDESLIGFGLG